MKFKLACLSASLKLCNSISILQNWRLPKMFFYQKPLKYIVKSILSPILILHIEPNGHDIFCCYETQKFNRTDTCRQILVINQSKIYFRAVSPLTFSCRNFFDVSHLLMLVTFPNHFIFLYLITAAKLPEVTNCEDLHCIHFPILLFPHYQHQIVFSEIISLNSLSSFIVLLLAGLFLKKVLFL